MKEDKILVAVYHFTTSKEEVPLIKASLDPSAYLSEVKSILSKNIDDDYDFLYDSKFKLSETMTVKEALIDGKKLYIRFK